MNKILIDQSTVEQALDALEAHADIGIKSDKVITALRTALEQSVEQEPVAWMFHSGDVWKFKWHHFNRPTGDALYISQQRLRQPLTDEQIGKLASHGYNAFAQQALYDFRAFARAIERAHGIGD